VFNTQIAKAKINLCLHVTGQNTDGYHLLDSLVVFADCGDELTFKRNQNLEIILDQIVVMNSLLSVTKI